MNIYSKAPARVDLAGGTYDIWPIYLNFSKACTINFAIDRYAVVNIETSNSSEIVIKSEDLQKTEHYLHLNHFLNNYYKSEIMLISEVIAYFKPSSGFQVTTKTNLPIGSGLANSSALLIALCGAFNKYTDSNLSKKQIIKLARDIESVVLKTPTGVQDYYPAIYGGILGINLDKMDVDYEKIACDPDWLTKQVILCYTGQMHQSGIQNWEVMKRFFDHDPDINRSFEQICRATLSMRKSLENQNVDGMAGALKDEWDSRRLLSDTIVTNKISSLTKIAKEHGSLAAKVCGAGGGGTVVFFARQEDKTSVEKALISEGGQLIDFKIDTDGLVVK